MGSKYLKENSPTPSSHPLHGSEHTQFYCNLGSISNKYGKRRHGDLTWLHQVAGLMLLQPVNEHKQPLAHAPKCLLRAQTDCLTVPQTVC